MPQTVTEDNATVTKYIRKGYKPIYKFEHNFGFWNHIVVYVTPSQDLFKKGQRMHTGVLLTEEQAHAARNMPINETIELEKFKYMRGYLALKMVSNQYRNRNFIYV